ncbi:hypothetical protein LINGRAHAP2_LOCUS10778 [Linum grandiflorum]
MLLRQLAGFSASFSIVFWISAHPLSTSNFKAGVVDYPFGALKDWKNDRRRVAAHRCGSRWKCCIFSLACLSIDAPQLMSSSPSFVGLDLSFFLYLLYSCLKKVKRLPFYLASTGM